jgi:hypothetical protein
MTRNELIQALIRVAGVILLVTVIIELPAYLGGFILGTYEFFRVAFKVSFGTAIDTVSFSRFFIELFTYLIMAGLGFYLMRGGGWFTNNATKQP